MSEPYVESSQPEGKNPLNPGRALIAVGVLLLAVGILAGVTGIIIARAMSGVFGAALGGAAVLAGLVGSFLCYKKPYQNIAVTAGAAASIAGVGALVIGLVRP